MQALFKFYNIYTLSWRCFGLYNIVLRFNSQLFPGQYNRRLIRLHYLGTNCFWEGSLARKGAGCLTSATNVRPNTSHSYSRMCHVITVTCSHTLYKGFLPLFNVLFLCCNFFPVLPPVSLPLCRSKWWFVIITGILNLWMTYK